jgi:thiol:disulfide interchange protein DsbC
MRKLAIAIALASLSGLSLAGTAQDAAKELFPGAKTKLNGGLLEVDAKVLITADGRQVIVGGRPVETAILLGGLPAAAQPAAAAQAPQMPPKADFSKLPMDKAIKVVKGDGKRVFAVFTDVDCPYCKQLEKTLSEMDNYTMYVFMLPIDQLHPAARQKSAALWCAKDRAAAWSAYWQTGSVPGGYCANPLNEIAQIAEGLGIRGTPTLIRQSDGQILPGAAPKAAMEMFLNGTPLPTK